MNNLEKFIESFDLKGVSTALESTLESAESVLLWQNIDGENRHIRDAFIERFSIKSARIVFSCALEKESFDFDKRYEVYVRLTHRSLIFKTTIHRTNEKYAEVELPVSYFLIENRSNERYTPMDQTVTIEKKADVLGQTRFELIGIDTSLRGLGLGLSVTKIKMFQVDDLVYLKKIGTFTFEVPVLCRVAHITCLEEDTALTARDYKLGLELLDQDLPDNIFKKM